VELSRSRGSGDRCRVGRSVEPTSRHEVVLSVLGRSGLHPVPTGVASPAVAWFSARDKLVGAIFALNEARAGERQMSGDKPPFVGSKLIEEAQSGRYSAAAFMGDWAFPPRLPQ